MVCSHAAHPAPVVGVNSSLAIVFQGLLSTHSQSAFTELHRRSGAAKQLPFGDLSGHGSSKLEDKSLHICLCMTRITTIEIFIIRLSRSFLLNLFLLFNGPPLIFFPVRNRRHPSHHPLLKKHRVKRPAQLDHLDGWGHCPPSGLPAASCDIISCQLC